MEDKRMSGIFRIKGRPGWRDGDFGLNCENANKKQAGRLFYPGFVRMTLFKSLHLPLFHG